MTVSDNSYSLRVVRVIVSDSIHLKILLGNLTLDFLHNIEVTSAPKLGSTTTMGFAATRR